MARLWHLASVGPQELKRWTLIWEKTGNVAAAWRTYRLAREWELPVPSSVMAEFDRIAIEFEQRINEVREGAEDASGLKIESAGRIVTKAGRGQSDPADALLAWERDFAIADAISFLRYDGATEKSAVERVSLGTTNLATKFLFEGTNVRMVSVATPAVSTDLVRQAVRRVRKLFEDE